MAVEELTLSPEDFETVFNGARVVNQNGIVVEGSEVTLKIDIIVTCGGGDQTLLADSTFTFTQEFIEGVCP